MLAIEVRWLAGRFHATPWGRHVNEGATEWPPSPWRLLRALVASWKLVAPDLPEPTVASLLTRLAQDPPHFQLPAPGLGHTRHYVPFQGKSRLLLDAFVTVPPDAPAIFHWPRLELAAEEQQVLDRLLAGIGYFGRSESWAVLSRGEGDYQVHSQPLTDPQNWSHTHLLCPTPEVTVAQLRQTTRRLRSAGYPHPPGSRWVAFTLPTAPPQPTPGGQPRPRLATHLLVVAVPKAETLPFAHRLRQALLGGEPSSTLLGGDPSSTLLGGDPSPTLLGKDKQGSARQDGHRHLHILPEGAGDNIEQVHLWAEEGFGPEDLRRLANLRVVPATRHRRAVGLILSEISARRAPFGQATAWRSLTPFLPPRHPRRGGADSPEAQVRRECLLRGLPQPLDVQPLPPPPDKYHLRRGRTTYGAGAPACFRLLFPTPVEGPLCLGAASHFGLGRFVPEG